MITPDIIATALAEAGSMDDEIGSILQRGRTEWVVRFEDLDVQLELNERTGRLHWHCELGAVTPEKRPEIYETFLRYNFLAAETGGVTLALDGDSAVLMVETSGSEPAPSTFRDIIANFLSKARIWREIMADGIAVVTPESFEPFAFGMRV